MRPVSKATELYRSGLTMASHRGLSLEKGLRVGLPVILAATAYHRGLARAVYYAVSLSAIILQHNLSGYVPSGPVSGAIVTNLQTIVTMAVVWPLSSDLRAIVEVLFFRSVFGSDDGAYASKDDDDINRPFEQSYADMNSIYSQRSQMVRNVKAVLYVELSLSIDEVVKEKKAGNEAAAVKILAEFLARLRSQHAELSSGDRTVGGLLEARLWSRIDDRKAFTAKLLGTEHLKDNADYYGRLLGGV